MEKWKVFYYNEKELGAYTLKGTFDGEEEATKEQIHLNLISFATMSIYGEDK